MVLLIAIVQVIFPSAFINSENQATKCAWEQSQVKIAVDNICTIICYYLVGYWLEYAFFLIIYLLTYFFFGVDQ